MNDLQEGTSFFTKHLEHAGHAKYVGQRRHDETRHRRIWHCRRGSSQGMDRIVGNFKRGHGCKIGNAYARIYAGHELGCVVVKLRGGFVGNASFKPAEKDLVDWIELKLIRHEQLLIAQSGLQYTYRGFL